MWSQHLLVAMAAILCTLALVLNVTVHMERNKAIVQCRHEFNVIGMFRRMKIVGYGILAVHYWMVMFFDRDGITAAVIEAIWAVVFLSASDVLGGVYRMFQPQIETILHAADVKQDEKRAARAAHNHTVL